MKPSAASPKSAFMQQVLPLFTSRYTLRYAAEGDCIEYFLEDNATREEISQNLMLSLNRFAGRMEIIRFYPELNRQPDSKYFSAACFYLLVHHFGRLFALNSQHRIFVRTRPEIYTRFYQSLKDFSFRPQFQIANTIDLVSPYVKMDVDTSGIREKPTAPNETDKTAEPGFMIA